MALWGGWRIGGIDYIATQATRFQQKHGNFQVGNPVKVQYYLDANGSRVMKKLETKPANTVAYPRYKLYGVVEQMPSNSFNGNWVIGGMVFTADTQTRFMEQRGLLAIGAYVEVEYVQNNGINWATQIETHVPPRAGANTYLGRIERMDSDSVTAAEATVSATTWRIGGREYQVTLATDVNDYQIDLGLGTMVLVNSYTDASGIEVVTCMEGVELNHTTFLPMTTR